ncbi:MAG: efflux RND transporter permease subunit, partial [Gammaproteobacteria bacterium]|nr:efflux RND transporter permease subunit [Gammaproteobacteria bacterium]
MNLTRLALSNPVAAVVAVLLVLLFGTIALLQIPVQMIPTVVIPRITITTPWRAAAPEEVESEIIEAQEDALRGVPGVDKLVSSAAQGQATISLTFDPGVPVERALIEVINGLN